MRGSSIREEEPIAVRGSSIREEVGEKDVSNNECDGMRSCWEDDLA